MQFIALRLFFGEKMNNYTLKWKPGLWKLPPPQQKVSIIQLSIVSYNSSLFHYKTNAKERIIMRANIKRTERTNFCNFLKIFYEFHNFDKSSRLVNSF